MVAFIFADIDLVEDILRFFIAPGAGAYFDVDRDLRLVPGTDGNISKLIVYLQLIFGCNVVGAIDEFCLSHILGRAQ